MVRAVRVLRKCQHLPSSYLYLGVILWSLRGDLWLNELRFSWLNQSINE